MFKDNGRLKPADKVELANLKGKTMYCAKCDVHTTMTNVEFAEIMCVRCGGQLIETTKTNAGRKATGRK